MLRMLNNPIIFVLAVLVWVLIEIGVWFIAYKISRKRAVALLVALAMVVLEAAAGFTYYKIDQKRTEWEIRTVCVGKDGDALLVNAPVKGEDGEWRYSDKAYRVVMSGCGRKAAKEEYHEGLVIYIVPTEPFDPDCDTIVAARFAIVEE